MGEKQRQLAILDHPAGHAAEQALLPSRVVVSPHDDEVRAHIHCVPGDDLVGALAFARKAIDLHLDAVAGKEGRYIGTRLSPFTPVRAIGSTMVT